MTSRLVAPVVATLLSLGCASQQQAVRPSASPPRIQHLDAVLAAAEQYPCVAGLHPIPATFIDNGVFAEVPYQSFSNGNVELNAYGDPANLVGLEAGTRNEDAATQQCLVQFIAAQTLSQLDQQRVMRMTGAPAMVGALHSRSPCFRGPMFQRDFVAYSTATPETLWPLYADVGRWKTWDEAIDSVTLDGAFVQGARGTLSLRGKPVLDFTLTEVHPNQSFSDETRVGPMTVRFAHTLTRVSGGTKVTHRVCIEGPGAEELGAAMQVQRSVEALARLGAAQTSPVPGGVVRYTPDVGAKVAF